MYTSSSLWSQTAQDTTLLDWDYSTSVASGPYIIQRLHWRTSSIQTFTVSALGRGRFWSGNAQAPHRYATIAFLFGAKAADGCLPLVKWCQQLLYFILPFLQLFWKLEEKKAHFTICCLFYPVFLKYSSATCCYCQKEHHIHIHQSGIFPDVGKHLFI